MNNQDKVTKDFIDELEKQSPLDAFKDALKGGDRAEKQALLDDFAKAAMQGILSSSTEMRAHGASYGDDGYYPVSSLAKEAYDIAQAMMQERERRMKG